MKEKENNIYAEFGSFCHSILEQYFNLILTEEELLPYYIEYFDDFITRTPWNSKSVDKLYDYGFAYFSNINYKPERMDILGVELKYNINIGGYNTMGYIDLVYKEGDDIVVCDHKSCECPIGKNGQPKKSSLEKFESFKKQLYLYSAYIKSQYGKFPKYLEWNFFRAGKRYRIEFNPTEFDKSILWANDIITEIYNTDVFVPNPTYFYCNNLCDFRNVCEFKA